MDPSLRWDDKTEALEKWSKRKLLEDKNKPVQE